MYSTDGISPTLNTMTGGGSKQPKIKIPEATRGGYALAEIGDSINLSVMGSKTRRGRVGKKIAQTLDTGMQQYTISELPRGSYRGSSSTKIAPTLREATYRNTNLSNGFSIRRLTPIECERLQGFPDNWTGGVSDTQRYKCTGNAVTVNVIRAICDRLF